MFNLSGSEIVIILLLALVVLGPDKLPDAMRRAGRTWAELRKMSNSFQDEVRKGFEEPSKELRQTAATVRKAAALTTNPVKGAVKSLLEPPEAAEAAETAAEPAAHVEATAEAVEAKVATEQPEPASPVEATVEQAAPAGERSDAGDAEPLR